MRGLLVEGYMKSGKWLPVLFLGLFLGPANSLPAQELLHGKYHRDRERAIDIIHYQADLGFDFAAREVHGAATVVFSPLVKTDAFSLDAFRLQIKEVDLVADGAARPLPFTVHEETVEIGLGRVYSPGESVTVRILYSARPNAGMYFAEEAGNTGRFIIYTYGAGEMKANWLPIYVDYNDKFSSEMIVSVPPPYTVVSNGKLVDVQGLENGDRRFHWNQALPHSQYLIALFVGEFEKGELAPALGKIPVGYWVPKGRLEEGEATFRNTTQMIEFFSRRLAYPYPWEKYDQIAVPDYGPGAMENTSITGQRLSILNKEPGPANLGSPDFQDYHSVWTAENLISHELAHSWFGNNLTCRNMNHVWLNESFATYLHLLWDEESLGKETFDLDRQKALDDYLSYVKETHTIRPLEYASYDTISDMYISQVSYLKGAIVLHTLRKILGDDAFFQALSYFLHKHEYSNVISSDFHTAIEEAVGRNLDWFFDDWVTGGGYPVFEVAYSFLGDRKLIDLSVSQVQPIVEGQDLFTLPVEITIVTSKGERKETVWAKNRSDRFLLRCEEEPLMVSFDGGGALVAEVRFDKPVDELAFQAGHDEIPGRIRAMRDMARLFPVHQKTVRTLADIISGESFWGLKAEAALLLGKLRTPEAEGLLLKALQAADHRVRKAAVLALPDFRKDFTQKTLKSVIQRDRHADVVGTAIVSLAKADPAGSGDFIRGQLGRPAWDDEIDQACLTAFEIMADRSRLPDIERFTADENSDHLQLAALAAWGSCAPDDPKLHRVLMERAESGKYGVKWYSLGALGDLRVEDARPILEKTARESGDNDMRVKAEQALAKISRLSGFRDN
jgi:aminopeptidase N